jgi:hypothetical protein
MELLIRLGTVFIYVLTQQSGGWLRSKYTQMKEGKRIHTTVTKTSGDVLCHSDNFDSSITHTDTYVCIHRECKCFI